MKILRVDDDVHEIIKLMADKEDRKLTPFLNRLFREMKDGRINQGLLGITPTPEKNNSRATPDLGDVFNEPTVVPLED